MKMMKGKIMRSLTALLLAAAIMIPGLPVYSTAPEVPATVMKFKDVEKSRWSYDFIYRIYALGIMNGISDTQFAPEMNMTRAMFVTALAKLDGEDISGYYTRAFNDVAPGAYYNGPVAWANEKGIAKGTGEKIFSPDKNLSREELVLMIFSYCKYKEIDVSLTDRILLSTYFDNSKVASYALDAFSWAVNYGFVSGVSKGCADPKGNATREQVACIFWKLLCYDPADALEVPDGLHLVRFLDYDGSVISEVRVPDGGSAEFGLSNPVRPSTDEFRYKFAGWSRYYDNITEDTDTRAVYKPIRRIFYTVRFCNYDGTLLQESTVEEGYSVEYTGVSPTRPTDNYCSYTFVGWNASSENVQSDLTITAKYTSKSLISGSVENRYDTFAYDTITVNNSDFRLSDSLYFKLHEASKYAGGRKIGFYLIDIATGMSVGYNAADSFQTASTVKLGLGLYAYKQIALGKAKLTDRITYRPMHYCEGSGVLINTASYGQSFTLKYLLHLMIHESDNIAYYMVHDYFGTAGYNAMIRSLGGFHEHSSTRTWGYLTPQELGLIWREIYKFRDTCWEGEYFFNELLAAKFNFIKTGFGYKYSSVAHKSGFNEHGYHDSAVIFGERPFIMVIMMSPSLGYSQGYLSLLAKMLDEVEQEYITWLKTHTN